MTSPRSPANSRVCATCGEGRVFVHPELCDLAIAHLDCDAFFAAVEKRDNPDIADLPVIVGGGVRGVVTTACYIARTYGVRSAMPMFKARRACPDAVVIRPNIAKYVEVGRAVRELMRTLTPLVEPLSVDEAFLDLSGTERLHGGAPALSLARLQKRIKAELGVSVSIGLSHNKFLAKLASDLDKPEGFSIIGRAETKERLAAMPVTAIWGVGGAMAAKLARDGLTTIGQLQTTPRSELAARYGEIGLRLSRLSVGEDARPVSTERQTKSISSETTFGEDETDIERLEDYLWTMCEKVSARLKTSGYIGRVLTLKLKTADFRSLTRRTALDPPTNLARILFAAARRLLRAAAPRGAYRLIGVGLSELTEDGAGAPDLFAADLARLAAQEKAIDGIRDRYGAEAIGAARAMRKPKK